MPLSRLFWVIGLIAMGVGASGVVGLVSHVLLMDALQNILQIPSIRRVMGAGPGGPMPPTSMAMNVFSLSQCLVLVLIGGYFFLAVRHAKDRLSRLKPLLYLGVVFWAVLIAGQIALLLLYLFPPLPLEVQLVQGTIVGWIAFLFIFFLLRLIWAMRNE